MPVPNGPSRKSVGGTQFNDIASLIKYAANSRLAKVPSGKSQSGLSPDTGL